MTRPDRARLAGLLAAEAASYRARNPKSRAAFEGAGHLLAGVPMTWMSKWAGGFALSVATARGAEVVDVDGHALADFALGDTGAMAGHSPAPLVEALARRAGELGGVTTMLPTEDAEWVAAELSRRFGLARWSFTLSATDANRWVLRLARMVTGRPKVLVFSYCYHGTVDETIVVAQGGRTVARPGNAGPAVDPATTSVAVEFNDLAALEAALAARDVACVLTEPALTNIGIVLPEPGFLEGVRAACDATGTLLVLDETHTFSAGPGGATRRWGLRPDALTIGKSLGGGVPCGAYGLTEDLADRVVASAVADGSDLVDVGGVGGTLAGNALSLAAMRAVLGEVLTDDAFVAMEALSDRFADGVQGVIDASGLDWSVTRLGARCEYRFANPAPTSGGESAAAGDGPLEDYLHLAGVNRGVLITPFHNMALTCPATTPAQVDAHTESLAAAVGALLA